MDAYLDQCVHNVYNKRSIARLSAIRAKSYTKQA